MIENYTVKLDLSGLPCPLPLLKAKKALSTLAAGDIIYIISTDPGSVGDFQSFARQLGHELLLCEEQAKNYHIALKKAEG